MNESFENEIFEKNDKSFSILLRLYEPLVHLLSELKKIQVLKTIIMF